MELEGMSEISTILYLAKQLYDLDRFNLVTDNFYDLIVTEEHGLYDAYMENIYGLIENIFEHFASYYYSKYMVQVEEFSGQEIEDYYKLAGEYGEQNNLKDEENPYFQKALDEARDHFDFSYSLDFKLYGHTKPKRKFHSRLVLFYDECEIVDLGHVAQGLIMMHEWFCEEVTKLRAMMNQEVAA